MSHGLNFFDTSILVYAFAESGTRTSIAENLLAEGGVFSVQVLNEFVAVVRRKFNADFDRAQRFIDKTLQRCPDPSPLTLATHRTGVRLCARYGFSIYDGVLIAAALEAGCKIIYTEDLQHGQVIDGLRIENPFLS